MGNHLPGHATRPSRGTPWKQFVEPAGPTWIKFLIWVWVKAIPNPSGNIYGLKDKITSASRPSRKIGISLAPSSPKLLGGGVARLASPNYSQIDPLTIRQKGVEKLVADLDPSKVSWPDHIHFRFLKEMAHELAPVFTCIFKQSIATATLLKVWTDAYVAAVFNRGPRCMPDNHRPVSRTCLPCKILEHIIAKHYRDHLERHGILNYLNHGFRSKFSCETQLLLSRTFWPFGTAKFKLI